MHWFNWFLVVYFALNGLLSIIYIGKEKKPIEPSTACFVILLMGLLIAGVIYFRG